MSYCFSIIGPRDNPLFTHEFGTSKGGGDGLAHFRDEAGHMNDFIINASLDMVDELQWASKELYLKRVDSFQNNHIHCFITGGNCRFMLLMNADPSTTPYANYMYATQPSSRPATARTNVTLASNPSSAQTEEAVKSFMLEVYEAFVRCLMNPFYQTDQEVTSPVFRSRVAAAAKKYL